MSKVYEKLNMDQIPSHICIIMDGNGRWASKRLMPRTIGHKAGMERVIEIVETARMLGVKYLSLYAFSTENWKRPTVEINALMDILVNYIRNQLNRLIENGVKLNIMGDLSALPQLPRDEVDRALKQTRNNDTMVLNIGINYGGRDELITAIKQISNDVVNGDIKIEDIDINLISAKLYTAGQPDPDLLIRPGSEKRISNFMIYQIAYTELYFTEVLWPDFDSEELYKAIYDYQNRNRRYGGL